MNPTVNNTIWNSLSFVQASGSRDLMQLEGGPLTFAIGAGDVYRILNSPNPGAGQDGTVSIPGATTYAVGSQNNAYAYVELAAPVLKNLEIDAALRYDYYNAPNNNTWNPKVGVKWTPIAVAGAARHGGNRIPGAVHHRGRQRRRDVQSCNHPRSAELPGQLAQRPAEPYLAAERAGHLQLQPRLSAEQQQGPAA